MQLITVWQYGTSNPENAKNLETIAQWWTNLNGKEVTWVQRLIPQIGGLSEIHWTPQRFDENFVMIYPQLRGITLYWFKPDSPVEHNTTVGKLELDRINQQLYIYPQTQKELIIRVTLSEVKYQTLELKKPEINFAENRTLILRDNQQRVEVKVALSADHLKQLNEWLSLELE